MNTFVTGIETRAVFLVNLLAKMAHVWKSVVKIQKMVVFERMNIYFGVQT
jgi:hypothetical protein